MTDENMWLRFALDAECDTALEQLALIMLGARAERGSGVVSISYKELASLMRCTSRAAIRAVESLCEKRHLAKHAMVSEDGGQLPNAYVVMPAWRGELVDN